MNSVTELSELSLVLGGSFYGKKAVPSVVNYDQVDIDLTIKAPVETGHRIYLVGLQLVPASNYNLILKSGGTVVQELQMVGNSGIIEPFDPSNPKILVNSEANEALLVQCDVVLPKFTLYFVSDF